MKYYLSIILSICLCIACNRSKDKVIASVYDKTLTVSDLQQMLPDYDSQTDSLNIQSYYINLWIEKQVLLHQAKDNLTTKEQNFDKQINDYYESLMVFAYENKKVESLLDKEVSDNEIRQYYEKNKSEFEMKKNIVKVNYIKFSVGFAQLELAKKLLFKDNRSQQDQKKLENLCVNYADNVYMENDWLLFDDILKEIPINTYNQEQYLQKNRNIELSDTNSVYLVKIIDFKINEAYSPINVEKENIKKIILNQRRQVLLKQIKNEALQKAKKEHAIEINIEKK
jgi:hypothetical protein